MQKYWNNVLDEQGRPRYGASVAVQQSGVNSTIYSDSSGLIPKTNPLTTDATRGYFDFFAAAGVYDLVVTGVGFASYTITAGAEVGLPSGDVTFVQSGIGAVTRTMQAKGRDIVSVADFLPVGYVTDGSVNYTTQFTSAFAAAKHVRIPVGTFLIDGLSLSGSGYVIEGDGAGVTTLKGSATCTKILEFAGASSATVDNVLRNLTLDMTNLTDDTSHIGLAFSKSWNNVVEKVTVTGQGSSKRSLRFGSSTAGQACYTSRFTSCDFGSTNGLIQVVGNNLATDATTTTSFNDCQFGQAILDSVFGINFNAATVQGSLNKFVLSNALCLNIIGGDMEGTGTYLQVGTNVTALQSLNNNITSALTYSSGTALNSLLQDRTKGFFGKANGKASLNIANTNPTTIYTFTDVSSAPSYSAALMVVYGDDGTRGWTDLIMVSLGIAPVTISSNATYGAGQPTRTYTYSSANVVLALSAAVANNVRVLVLEYMGA